MLSLSMTAIAQGDRDSNDGVKIVKGEKDLDVSTHIAQGTRFQVSGFRHLLLSSALGLLFGPDLLNLGFCLGQLVLAELNQSLCSL